MSQMKFWRSFEELEGSESYKNYLHREFQEGASEQEEGVSRRSFLKLMGASVAMAGLVGCGIRKPKQVIKPYVKRPEDHLPGKSVYYASALSLYGESVGVLCKTSEGRPTKLEGNPTHSRSLGALTAQLQGLVLGLYDPDRLVFPKEKQNGEFVRRGWDDFSAFLSSGVISGDGQGVAVLLESNQSPFFYHVLNRFIARYPKAVVSRYDGLNRDSLDQGLAKALGAGVAVDYRYDLAQVVVSIDADFLGNDPACVINSKRFSERRDPETGSMSRLYLIESGFSITGAKADHRVGLKPSMVEPALWVVADALFASLGAGVPASVRSLVAKGAGKYSAVLDSKLVASLVADLIANRGQSVVVAGPTQPESVHVLVALINQVLGNVGKTVEYRRLAALSHSVNTLSSADSISKLVSLLNEGEVTSLVMLGGNPVYSLPASLRFSEVVSKVKSVIHLTDSENETSVVANWIIPRAHVLESWGDAESLDGSVSLVQPVIRPLYDGRTDAEFLLACLGGRESGFAELRQFYRSKTPLNFESTWKKWVHNGVISSASPLIYGASVNVDNVASLVKKALDLGRVGTDLELLVMPSYAVFDGRFSNNGWMQELPDPITKLTWDNAVLVSPSTASRLGISLNDLVEITTSTGESLKVAVMVVPGYSDNTLGISTGYGRQVVGRIGKGAGFNVHQIQSLVSSYFQTVSVKASGETYVLASTQNHGSMEGRAIVRQGSLAQYKKHPRFAPEMVHTQPLKSLWTEHDYSTGYQWGMVIDLTKCTSCNACVTACQSENNIPIVGKEQVLNGREMHWIRLDRYFEGDQDTATIVSQPVTCLQCENAPCEQVCPVAATVHSKEGLNDMVYNRCIGTRYCSNNCPVKVRRFNFFDFHQRNPQSVKKSKVHLFDYFREPDKQIQKQFNPDVTVRMRGVMEKCTYCIQRINTARVKASNDNRLIRDGDVLAACQQTCPTGAIVFGNINDASSKVAHQKKINRDYGLLEELFLKPRTSYLALIRNPHPDLVSLEDVQHGSKH